MTHVRVYEQPHGLCRRFLVASGIEIPEKVGDSLLYKNSAGETTIKSLKELIERGQKDNLGQTFHSPVAATRAEASALTFTDSTATVPPFPAVILSRTESFEHTIGSLSDLYLAGPPAQYEERELYYWDSDVQSWCIVLSHSELAAVASLNATADLPVHFVECKNIITGGCDVDAAKEAMASLIEARRPAPVPISIPTPISTPGAVTPMRPARSGAAGTPSPAGSAAAAAAANPHCTAPVTAGVSEGDLSGYGASALKTGDVHIHAANTHRQATGEVPQMHPTSEPLWDSPAEREAALEGLRQRSPTTLHGLVPDTPSAFEADVVAAQPADSFARRADDAADAATVVPAPSMQPSPCVLVVCDTNRFASQAAAAMLSRKVESLGMSDWSFGSAGVRARAGERAPEQSVALLRASGVDVSTHRVRVVTGGLLDASDVVLCMEQAQVDELVARFPAAATRVHLFAGLVGGGSVQVPASTEGAMGSFVKELQRVADGGVDRLKRLVAQSRVGYGASSIAVAGAQQSRAPTHQPHTDAQRHPQPPAEGSPLVPPPSLSSHDLTLLLGHAPFPKWAKSHVECNVADGGRVAFFVQDYVAFAATLVAAAQHILASQDASMQMLTDAVVLLAAAAYCDPQSVEAVRQLSVAYARRYALGERCSVSASDVASMLRGREVLWPGRAPHTLAAEFASHVTDDGELSILCLSEAVRRGLDDEAGVRSEPAYADIRHSSAFADVVQQIADIRAASVDAARQHMSDGSGECALAEGYAQHVSEQLHEQSHPRSDVRSPLDDGSASPCSDHSPIGDEPAASEDAATVDQFRRVEDELRLLGASLVSRAAVRERVRALRVAWEDYREHHGGSTASAARCTATTAAGAASEACTMAARECARELTRARDAAAASATALHAKWREIESNSATPAEAVQQAAASAARAVQPMVETEFAKVDEALRWGVGQMFKGAQGAAAMTQQVFEQVARSWTTWMEQSAEAAESDGVADRAAAAAATASAAALEAARSFAEKVADALEKRRMLHDATAAADEAATMAGSAAEAALQRDGEPPRPYDEAAGAADVDGDMPPPDVVPDAASSHGDSSDVSLLFEHDEAQS